LNIAIDRNIFYLKSIDNGTLERIYEGLFQIKNIKIPATTPNEPTKLFTIIGNPLLGNTDSSEINLLSVGEIINLPSAIDYQINLRGGCITLDICREGGARLTKTGETMLLITNNPATEQLKIECDVIEKGKYFLEIIDILGNKTSVANFIFAGEEQTKYEFDIPIKNFGYGSYILLLTTPSDHLTEKFVVSD
jgi:hypothetical protein